ncbi:hypothetical protein H2248_002295 [Termitomyces sp. 'cryptogamus']|nr:hypothetical protein H2248_002295 [Termitomyces sp. 'cryptogamus']
MKYMWIPHEIHAVFAVLADNIPRLCFKLESLHIDTSMTLRTVFAEKLEEMLMQLPRLRYLDYTCNASITLTKHLATLPSLSYWSTGLLIPNPPEQTVYTSEGGRFQSIRTFHFTVQRWIEATKILHDMRCRFTKLEIHNQHIIEDHPLTFFEFLQTIAQHACSTTLTCLKLSDEHHDMNIPSHLDYLYPLFQLSALEELDLSVPEVKYINDAWLAQAAATWPSLRSLFLRHLTQTSLMGLALLLHKCPDLDATISAVWRSFDPRLLSGLPINYTKEHITIWDGFIEGDVLAVLRCLLGLFPCLQRLEGEEHFDQDQRWKWEKLREYLRRSSDHQIQ